LDCMIRQQARATAQLATAHLPAGYPPLAARTVRHPTKAMSANVRTPKRLGTSLCAGYLIGERYMSFLISFVAAVILIGILVYVAAMLVEWIAVGSIMMTGTAVLTAEEVARENDVVS